MMLSSDYKERFLAEYWQLRIRVDKLSKMLDDYEQGKLNFKPSSPISILYSQLAYMSSYMQTLSVRALAEQIDLNEPRNEDI
jgi:hypothetical protein